MRHHTRFANKGHPMSQIDGDNNIDPPMSTHTDAEFEQVKVELALEKEKTVGLRWLDIQNDYIIVSLRSDAVSLASRLNEASREHDELRVTLAASHTQVARLKEALQCVMDECQKHYEHNPVSGRNRLPEGYQTVGGIAADAIDATTAPAAQADLWLVWSNEHGAWWGPNESGYYTDIRSAGRYTKEKAMECADSRSHTKGKLPPEVIISERDAMEGKNPNAAQAGKAPQ
jgi:hypothetical protein